MAAKRWNVKTGMGIVMGVLALGVLGWLGWQAVFRPELPPPTTTAVLIDGTDEISRATREAVVTEMISLAEAADSGDVFLFATITGEDSPLVPVTVERVRRHPDRCDYMTCNRAMAERAHQDFIATIQDSVSAALSVAAPAERSHVMEGVREFSVTFLRRPPHRDKTHRLVVISDLLQNSETFSIYPWIQGGRVLDFAEIRNSGLTFSLLDTDLEGTEVLIYYVPRRVEFERSLEIVQFWSDWIHEQGGEIARVERLEGVN